ncbi:baculoviral IAP repeat-containing protein 2-like [Dreissena polymorpha]|uniref:RING-type domain-containing protein n=1 Tax=Dreissena polymorpha TaxID=45954 RepID=A0A9D4CRF7_DREPO|nr:baculoviral IAP repeat-containing protein 2-like [Dreissena polymorpha]KAH3729496.1 hypothetical protein DPMN_055468 [Dreissena polymorpha]
MKDSCILLYVIVIMHIVITRFDKENKPSLTEKAWSKIKDTDYSACNRKPTNADSVGDETSLCKSPDTLKRKFHLLPLDVKKQCRVAWMSVRFTKNTYQIAYEYVYINAIIEINEHKGQPSNESIAFPKFYKSERIPTMLTLLTSRRTELMQHLRNTDNIDSVTFYTINDYRRNCCVTPSGKSASNTAVIRVFQGKSYYLEFITTYLNSIIILVVLFWLITRHPNPQIPKSTKQDPIESFTCSVLDRIFQLPIKGSNKHLYQSYFSPNIEDTVCCPVTQETQGATINNFEHDKFKIANVDSDSQSQNNRSPGDGDSSKPENATKLSTVANVKMIREWDRYISYGKCPVDSHDSNVYPSSLAKNGFYFNLEHNLSECFSCGHKVSTWEKRESVKDAHLRISPKCDFANGKDTFNVPIHDDKTNEASENEKNNGACGGEETANIQPRRKTVDSDDKLNKNVNRHDNSRNETPQEELHPVDDTIIGNPRHPDFLSQEDRMSTFLNWAFPHVAPINRLVDAGLYHTGTADEVRCFQCGGGMRNWQPGDDPWMEHAYWFPHCEFVRHRRGQDFIDMVRMGRSFERGLDIGPSERTPQPSEEEQYIEVQTFSRQRANLRAPTADTAISELHDTSMVDSVADMGFNKDHVLLALGQIRRAHPEGHRIETEELIEYLLANPQPKPYQTTSERSAIDGKAAEHKKRKQNKKKSKEIPDAVTCPENTEISVILDENEKLKQQLMCKVCMDSDACVVFQPCGHMVTCVKCASKLRKCAICRRKIEGNIRIYLG